MKKLAGHVKGKKRSLSSMFEAVGSYAIPACVIASGSFPNLSTIERNLAGMIVPDNLIARST